MIDLHVHILPDLDDGAEDLAASLEMARVALADGVTTVFATPHSVQGGLQGGRPEMAARVAALEAVLREEGLGLKVVPGVEAFLAPDLPRQLDDGRVFTLNGSRYLLVELPYHQYPSYADQVLFEVQVRGLVPILAHPERNVGIQKDPQRLFNLAERGIKAQVTAASLTGAFGSRARAAARLMVKNFLAQIIASDAHSATGERVPSLSAAVAEAAQLVGQERARAMVTAAPEAVLANREIDWENPRSPRKERGLWTFWRRD